MLRSAVSVLSTARSRCSSGMLGTSPALAPGQRRANAPRGKISGAFDAHARQAAFGHLQAHDAVVDGLFWNIDVHRGIARKPIRRLERLTRGLHVFDGLAGPTYGYTAVSTASAGSLVLPSTRISITSSCSVAADAKPAKLDRADRRTSASNSSSPDTAMGPAFRPVPPLSTSLLLQLRCAASPFNAYSCAQRRLAAVATRRADAHRRTDGSDRQNRRVARDARNRERRRARCPGCRQPRERARSAGPPSRSGCPRAQGASRRSSPTSTGTCHEPRSPCSARRLRCDRYFVPAGAGFLKIFGPIEPGTAATQVSSVVVVPFSMTGLPFGPAGATTKGSELLPQSGLEEMNARNGLRARALLAAADTDRQRRQRVTRRLILHLAPVGVGTRIDRGNVLLGDAGGRQPRVHEHAEGLREASRLRQRFEHACGRLGARAPGRPSFHHDAWRVRGRTRRGRSLRSRCGPCRRRWRAI